MASFTLGPDSRFHVGDTLNCYRLGSGLIPASPIPVTSAAVAADSTTTFTGLDDGTRYLAGLAAAGPFVEFQTNLPIEQSGGVTYVANDGLLPTGATGHPVLLVLEDSTALDLEGNAQATLRYWTGEDWRIIGLAGTGGGTVSGDFIDIPANLAGMASGKTIIYNGTQFVPGSLS